MKPFEIKAALILRGIKVKDIARAASACSSNVSAVIYGATKTCRIRQAIAAAIDKPVEEVFPDTKEAA